MTAFLRSTGAVGLMFAITCGSVAATTSSETNYTSPDWQETCSLPSVTASSRIVHDDQVTPVGDNESTDQPACTEGCSSCDSSCHSCMTCFACEPSCYAMVGTVFLHRSRPDSSVVITPPTGTLGTIVNASDFDFGWDAGPDVTIGRRLSNGLIVEGRYFNDHSAEATNTVAGVTTFRLAGIGVTVLGGGDLANSYSTDLDSSELNVGTAITPGCTFFTGFRWIELHDVLHIGLAGTGLNLANWDESNHLYGGQIGTNILFTNPCSPFKFMGTLKAGAYGNQADTDFTSSIVSGARSHDNELAFVGEVDFTAKYSFTQHIGVYGGYQVMWLDNVAIAGDQAPTTVQAVGGTSSPIDTNGRVVYDGVTTGVDFTW
jgi:hypothetical protein